MKLPTMSDSSSSPLEDLPGVPENRVRRIFVDRIPETLPATECLGYLKRGHYVYDELKVLVQPVSFAKPGAPLVPVRRNSTCLIEKKPKYEDKIEIEENAFNKQFRMLEDIRRATIRAKTFMKSHRYAPRIDLRERRRSGSVEGVSALEPAAPSGLLDDKTIPTLVVGDKTVPRK